MTSDSLFKPFVLFLILFLLSCSQKEELKPTTVYTKAENARQRDLERTKMKGGRIDPMTALDAFNKVKANIKRNKSNLRDGGIYKWEWMGPGNIGGRIRAIAVRPTGIPTSPEEIFIGSAGGGMFKSRDNGATWSIVSDFLPSLVISSILVDFNNPDIMYASTGQGVNCSSCMPGAGIFKSTNGGNSWNQLTATANSIFFWVNRLAFDPTDPTIIYAATGSGTQSATTGPGSVYQSPDSGVTWNPLTTSLTGVALDVKVNPNNKNQIAVGTSTTMYLSDDGGASFIEQIGTNNGDIARYNTFTNELRCEVAFCEQNVNIIMVSRFIQIDNDSNGTFERDFSEIWKTVDAGASWTNPFAGANNNGHLSGAGWFANTIWIDPFNCNTLLAGGVDMFRSLDGAQTMEQISDWRDFHVGDDVDDDGNVGNSLHADQHIIMPALNYSQGFKKIYIGNDGGIQSTDNLVSVDTNSGWNNLNGSTMGITQFYGADVNNSGSRLIGGTQDNSFLVNSFGSTDWVQNTTADGGICKINQFNSNIMYATTQRMNIHKSVDGGQSFCYIASFSGGNSEWWNTGCSPIESYSDNPLFLQSPLFLNPKNSEIVYACGQLLWRSNNGGINWNSISPIVNTNQRISAMDISPQDTNDIWLGYEDGNVRINTGPGWSDIDVGIPNAYITDIAINPNNKMEAFITIGGYRDDNVYYTDDRGASWNELSTGIPALHASTVTWSPSNQNYIYVGTDLGVFASNDRGVTWNVYPIYSNNEGPVYTEVVDLFWQSDDYLYAATHGRGVYKTEIRNDLYVDKNCSPCGSGTLQAPYKTFLAAYNAAGNDARIVFLSYGTYAEFPPSLSMNKRISIEFYSPGSNPVIIE